MVTSLNSQSTNPSNTSLGRGNPVKVYLNSNPTTNMGLNAIATTGGNLPHNNMMPYMTMNFCIALQGVFPPRS